MWLCCQQKCNIFQLLPGSTALLLFTGNNQHEEMLVKDCKMKVNLFLLFCLLPVGALCVQSRFAACWHPPMNHCAPWNTMRSPTDTLHNRLGHTGACRRVFPPCQGTCSTTAIVPSVRKSSTWRRRNDLSNSSALLGAEQSKKSPSWNNAWSRGTAPAASPAIGR